MWIKHQVNDSGEPVVPGTNKHDTSLNAEKATSKTSNPANKGMNEENTPPGV